MSMLDDINKEIGELSDAELAEAAAKISASQEKAKASMTPERKARMKEREAFRRKKNAAILALAKQKGLVPGAVAEAATV